MKLFLHSTMLFFFNLELLVGPCPDTRYRKSDKEVSTLAMILDLLASFPRILMDFTIKDADTC